MKSKKGNSSAKLKEKRRIKYGFLIKYLTVEGAAYRMNCSTRRVRQLLQEQRLLGFKVGKDWQVEYPITLKIGERGPKNQLFIASSRGFTHSVSSSASKSQ